MPKLTEQTMQCAGCKEFFSGLSNFDKHRVWGGSEGDERLCLPPDAVKLHQRNNGVWGGQPMTDEQKRKAGWTTSHHEGTRS